MHELSLAGGVVRLVEDAAERDAHDRTRLSAAEVDAWHSLMCDLEDGAA